MSFKDKVVIVTGGANGIGLGIVNAFLAQEARVAVVDISKLEQFSGPGKEDDSVLPIQCDVGKDDDVTKAVDAVIKKWGRVDVLVNNAGVMDNFGRAGDISDTTWRRCFTVNVDGPMFFIRRCIPIFLKQETKGSIVNVCSTAAFRGAAAGVAYTASKHALLGISRNTSWAYAKDGITCNVVAPGAVPGTNIVSQEDFAKIDQAGYAASEPFTKLFPGMCTPDDIAGAVLYLAGAKAVNGAEISVDKGILVA